MKKSPNNNTLTIAIVVIFGLFVLALVAFMMRGSDDAPATNTNTVTTNANKNTNTRTNANKNTNSNKNTNTTANANTNATNANVNATNANSNTNSSVNTNTNTSATNTNTNTSASTNTNSGPVAASDKNENEVVEDAEGNRTRIVDLYFIALEDNGKNGDAVGCGDSAVAIEKTANVTGFSTDGSIYAALSFLFVYNNQTVGEYYNALYQSDLAVEDVSLSGGVATVYLSGTHVLGGTCDAPRFKAQIEKTATQFTGVNSAVIYINDEKIDDVLSTK